MAKVEFIIYVRDQQKSSAFYQSVLKQAPVLNVPGMTEFQISEDTKIGIMPEAGVKKILRHFVPDPAIANGIPRCEIYLYVDAPTEYVERALEAGAILIDEEKDRDWGDRAAYCADLDGHILAFACKIKQY
jgi:uncharacterized glyoxalase superfamily protein PhnB